MKTFKSLAAVAVAAIALTGCSAASDQTQGGSSWTPAAAPSPVMDDASAVIPDGTYNFTFTSSLPGEGEAIAESISASGRIYLQDTQCVLTADVKSVVNGTETTYKVIKPADKSVHVFDGATQQWFNDPIAVAFQPLLNISGAGATPKADDYMSFCVLNGFRVFLEQSKEANQQGTFTVNAAAYEQFLKSNADWFINEIIGALRYAGDTREKAVPVFQKLFRLDSIDVKAGADTIFTRIAGADGSITLESAKGRNFDGGTFVLTPTEEEVLAILPKDGVPTPWAKSIANGVELAGSLDNYVAGKFPANE